MRARAAARGRGPVRRARYGVRRLTSRTDGFVVLTQEQQDLESAVTDPRCVRKRAADYSYSSGKCSVSFGGLSAMSDYVNCSHSTIVVFL